MGWAQAFLTRGRDPDQLTLIELHVRRGEHSEDRLFIQTPSNDVAKHALDRIPFEKLASPSARDLEYKEDQGKWQVTSDGESDE